MVCCGGKKELEERNHNKAVCKYIKARNLQYSEDKYRFVPDTALEELGIVSVVCDNGEKIHPKYFELQVYLNKLYTKQ